MALGPPLPSGCTRGQATENLYRRRPSRRISWRFRTELVVAAGGHRCPRLRGALVYARRCPRSTAHDPLQLPPLHLVRGRGRPPQKTSRKTPVAHWLAPRLLSRSTVNPLLNPYPLTRAYPAYQPPGPSGAPITTSPGMSRDLFRRASASSQTIVVIAGFDGQCVGGAGTALTRPWEHYYNG